MNPTAIFSKTGKGVQEASGKTSNLSRADRAVLKEIDGKTALQNIAVKFEKISADKFDALIAQFDKDGYIREVSSGASAPTPVARTAPPPPKAPPPKAPPAGGDEDEMDFTQAIKLPPKSAPAAPKAPVDLAAASRAESDRKEKEQQALDYKSRQEAEAKAKAESDARARAEAQARAAAEAKAKAESEARARAEAEARAAAEAKARGEAEAKVKAARDAALRMATEAKAKADAEVKAKAILEAELTGKLEAERRAREDAERRAAEASEQARKELEEKAKRDAEELRQRLEAEMKAKLDEERKAREAEDRKRREEEDQRRAEEDRKRREDDDRRRKEDEERRAEEAEERRAREEADRKKREEEDRRRAEEDNRRRKEEDERRAKEAEERKAREESDRKRREEDDRKRAEEDKRRKDDDARRAREDADRRSKDDADRRAREESDRQAKNDAEERARAARVTDSQISAAPVPPPPPPPAASSGGFGDSLLADLDSFGKREEEEQKAKEEADRKAKEEAERKAKAEADRKAKEEAERKAKAEAERKAKEEAERKAQEEVEQKAREEEERKKHEEAERKRKAKESLAAKEAERKAALGASAAPKPATKPAARPAGKPAAADDDIGVTDDDLDMDDVKSDEKALSATARKAQREKEQAAAIAAAPAPRPKNWGKLGAIAMFVLLIGGVAVLNLMPVSTSEYEKAASEAMGVPVKIGSARLSVLTGIEAKFDAVSIGDSVKIRTVRGYPDFGSLMGGKKSFSRIELEGVSLSQSQLADAMLGKVASENFRVGRILIKQAKLDGPLTLPALDVEALVSGDGSLQSVSLKGGDKLVVLLSPKGNDIGFEISAGSLALPFAPGLTLSDFGMKGTANRSGVVASEFDGRNFDGVITGTAKIRWGATWTVDGEVRARAIRVAVLAPALVSEGKVEGRGAYSMSGPNPATLFETARIQGEFKIDKGVLGSFDLTRALQTGGAQSTGRTVFSELTGQALYDKGAIRISNVAITAGAMNAGASMEVDANGGLSGRVVADVKTPTQTLRATLNLSGKIQDPVIRK